MVCKMEFNQNQKDVINYGEGTLLVEAGPGSGKTTVIIERIKTLIAKGVKPETFLVITFTTKAADNLKVKLKKHLPKDIINKMQISTIHSFCLDFLKGKNQSLNLIADDSGEKKELFIQKHKYELGFYGIHSLKNFQIPSVIDKYEEYTNFNVDTKSLVDYIEENNKISDKFIDFTNQNKYFTNKRIKDLDFKEDWYNGRFIQIARSYPKYLELLDKYSVVDFNTIQLKTLNKLKINPKTNYSTIFVDEFQDTDPLQFEIFKILIQNSKYFTAVGDIDQRIYSFRSTFKDYFDELESLTNSDRISLNVNYRSTDNIVNLSDAYIKHQRSDKSVKHLEASNQDYDNPCFILKSDKDTEAENIFNIIKSLEGQIKDFSDIAVLYRKNGSKTILDLIELLTLNDIPFTIKGQKDLKDKKEVKAILILLWYITRRIDKSYISSSKEYKWLNLKAFCDEDYEDVFWHLADETKQYLISLQESFEDEVTKIRNLVSPSKNGREKNFTGTASESEDVLIEIYSQVEKPTINLSKISNDNDKKFFEKLEELREVIDLEEVTILEIYYELLTLGNYFENIEENINQVCNLSSLTQTIYNYESTISKTDIRGLYFFLNRAIENYDANYVDNGGVQLMTVHSAKGLEFAVTIITSLEEDKFPMKPKDPERKKTNIFMKDTFYTPNEFLEYKYFQDGDEYRPITIEEENQRNIEEEERVIYVAMTRAADLLILSCIGEIPESIENIRPMLKEIDLDNVEIKKHFVKSDEDILRLNYSKYSAYKLCPHRFNLLYNLGFKSSDQEKTDLGTVFHNVMDILNQKLKDNMVISEKEVKNITEEIFESKFSLEENKAEFDEVYKNILNYKNNSEYNYEVLDSEVPFEVERENYILNGAIDLVYKISDTEIGILDYKHAEINHFKEDRYKEQLFIYASALKEIPGFENYTIREAKIYFAISKKGVTFKIKEDILSEQMEKLDNVALKIINKDFSEKRKSGYCDYCEYNKLC